MCVPKISTLYVSTSEKAKERHPFMEGDSPVAHTIKEKNDQSRNELKFPNATSPSEFIPSTSQGLGV